MSETESRNLRNPFRTIVTTGKTSTRHSIYRPLEPELYSPMCSDIYTALAEYNKSPYDLGPGIIIKELCGKWLSEYLKDASDTYMRSVDFVWIYCSSAYDMYVRDIRT